MFMYSRVPQVVAETCRSLADTSIKAECPSGNALTTLVRRRASSIGLLVFSFRQELLSKVVFSQLNQAAA